MLALTYSGVVFLCILIIIIIAIFINPSNTVQKRALKWAIIILIILFFICMSDIVIENFRRYTGKSSCNKPKIKKYKSLIL